MCTPQHLSLNSIIGYVCDVVAMAAIIKGGEEWQRLLELGEDGLGEGWRRDGNDDSSSSDEDDNRARGAQKRVRLLQNGATTTQPSGPRVANTPSKGPPPAKQSALMLALQQAERVSHKERGGGCVYVFAGETTVFKVFVADALSPAARELANEVAILKHLTHFAPAAVMPLLCVTSGVSLGYISALPATVLEIRRANGAPIDWPSLPRAGLLRRGEQVLAAVVTVSASLVVHGDISSGNIVVHDDVARLIDTGLSAQIDALSGLSARVAAGGTRGFIAPEIREAWDRGSGRLRLTPAVDVFSTGCVLALAESALRECPPLQQLVARMTAHDAGARPTAAEALAEWRQHCGALGDRASQRATKENRGKMPNRQPERLAQRKPLAQLNGKYRSLT